MQPSHVHTSNRQTIRGFMHVFIESNENLDEVIMGNLCNVKRSIPYSLPLIRINGRVFIHSVSCRNGPSICSIYYYLYALYLTTTVCLDDVSLKYALKYSITLFRTGQVMNFSPQIV